MDRKKTSEIMSLWFLLAVALAIFVGISFSDSFHIGNYYPTKGSFKEQLVNSKQAESTEEPVKAVQDTIKVTEPPKKLEPDTTVHSVLIFGDSMTHNLGISLAKYGTKNNFKVTSVTWESSSMIGWSESDKLEQYLEEVKPDYVIISLGSNELELKNFASRVPYIESIRDKIGDIPFIWVGPPLWKEDKGLYDIIEKTLSKDMVFRTEGIEIPRGGDHIHPTSHGADIWADTLMSWISWSKHPILAERPDSGTTTKGHRIIYLHPDE